MIKKMFFILYMPQKPSEDWITDREEAALFIEDNCGNSDNLCNSSKRGRVLSKFYKMRAGRNYL